MTRIALDLIDAPNQRVDVEAVGPDVARISGNAADPDAPEVMPDWCDLLVQAIDCGMMSGRHPPSSSRAAVVDRKHDPAVGRQTWRLSLERVDAGLFLVLLNVLGARELDAVSIRAADRPLDAKPLAGDTLVYPQRFGQLPFPVDGPGLPLRSTRDRFVHIEFAAEPDLEFSSTAETALGAWGNLLVLGGYAALGSDPRRSYTLPEFPYWLDSVTLAQNFEEIFDADPACFNALVNWAVKVHEGGREVKAITIH